MDELLGCTGSDPRKAIATQDDISVPFPNTLYKAIAECGRQFIAYLLRRSTHPAQTIDASNLPVSLGADDFSFSCRDAVTAKGGRVKVELLQGWAAGRVTLAVTSTVVMMP